MPFQNSGLGLPSAVTRICLSTYSRLFVHSSRPYTLSRLVLSITSRQSSGVPSSVMLGMPQPIYCTTYSKYDFIASISVICEATRSVSPVVEKLAVMVLPMSPVV